VVPIVVAVVCVVTVRSSRGGTREIGALVVFDQLVIGEALLVQRRLLLSKLRRGALAPCLLFGHASSLLGDLGLSLAAGRLFAVLIHNALTPLIELVLPSLQTGALSHPRQEQQQRDQNDHDDNDHDYQGSRHPVPPLSLMR
jgi:hypothetical protein